MTQRAMMIWAERVAAVLVAAVAVGVALPNIGPQGWPEHGHSGSWLQHRNPWVIGAYIAIACVLLAGIVIGQRRSRWMRLASWLLLLCYLILEVR